MQILSPTRDLLHQNLWGWGTLTSPLGDSDEVWILRTTGLEGTQAHLPRDLEDDTQSSASTLSQSLAHSKILRELRQPWDSDPPLFTSKPLVPSAALTPFLAISANTQQKGSVPLTLGLPAPWGVFRVQHPHGDHRVCSPFLEVIGHTVTNRKDSILLILRSNFCL